MRKGEVSCRGRVLLEGLLIIAVLVERSPDVEYMWFARIVELIPLMLRFDGKAAE